MSNYLIQGETLTNIANAIRTKTGKTDSIATENMATEISGLPIYPLYNGAYEVNKSGYTVTLELQTGVGNTVDYLTDNGLSGTITEDNSPLILEGVTSITLPNGMPVAAMSNVYIDGEYQSDIYVWEPFTIPITKNCTVTLVSDEG